MNKNEIEIDRIKYVKEDILNQTKPKNVKNCSWCIVRTYSAGVFYGLYNTNTKGKEGIVYNARRVYFWDGAATLSQLATEGTSKPENCKFPVAVGEVILKEIIEVIPMTTKSKESLDSVRIWKK